MSLTPRFAVPSALKVVYTPSSLGTTEIGDVILTHADLGDWVFEASGVGEMPGVMQEHRAVATVGSTTSTMFPFRYKQMRQVQTTLA